MIFFIPALSASGGLVILQSSTIILNNTLSEKNVQKLNTTTYIEGICYFSKLYHICD